MFEVLIPGVGENKSIILPSSAKRGFFWSSNSAANAGVGTINGQITGKLGDNADEEILGFNGREITTTGLRTDTQELFGEGSFEGYDTAGRECSVSPLPELFAVEDDAAHTHLSQTNPLTAVDQLVNFEGGLPRIAQAGEIAFYQVVGKEPGIDDPAQSRYVLRRLAAGVKV